MARTKQLSQDISNTGYTANAGMQRIMNRDGSLNVQRRGLNWWQRNSIYHTMISLSPGRFMLVVFLFYTSTNLLFACIYTLLGIDKLQGIDPVSGFGEKFMQAFSSAPKHLQRWDTGISVQREWLLILLRR
ncbi:hypothetical protein LWM68_03305 [Niabella sp. W65]|nr:hypothetical protein [Niabella sp. W65]MCH7361891.1 hypothetical protein [Niabella sp. W65]ULT45648.1 hypothetical protein KRR40_21845 [Niabella sp. I65]